MVNKDGHIDVGSGEALSVWQIGMKNITKQDLFKNVNILFLSSVLWPFIMYRSCCFFSTDIDQTWAT